MVTGQNDDISAYTNVLVLVSLYFEIITISKMIKSFDDVFYTSMVWGLGTYAKCIP